MILGQFAVPARYQQRVLLIGVLGALVLRGVFIAVGAAAVQRFAVTFLFFGVFLAKSRLAFNFGDMLPQAIPSLAVGQHPAIPRTDADLQDSNFLQAIGNTAGFHFATIEQGGTSLYAQLAQRVTSSEVLRIVLSIGGTEIMHFQTWSDKAGNAPPIPPTADPATGVMVSFPDLNSPPLGGEDFQTNLIMPEPTIFLNKKFPPVSIIRPTKTRGAALGALKALTADGLFIGQSRAFFRFMETLAIEADFARRENF